MTIFFVSDTHFCHANFLRFTDDSGRLVRPFPSVEAMNERMIEGWNSVVRDGDKVYHLGDVTFDYGKSFRSIMSRLRGKRRLLVGNHDQFKGTDLLDHFEKASLWRIFKEHNFICTHVPLHRDQIRKVAFNVHGHTHEKTVKLPGFGAQDDDPHYINVCVERINYTPVALDDLTMRMGA